jgi:hypothetical protein
VGKKEKHMKVKAKNMTKRDALPVLQKLLGKTEGKRKRRALEIAISTIRTRTDTRTAGAIHKVA